MQTRIESLKEACHNTWIGITISCVVQQWIITPLFELRTTKAENLAIVAIFTAISVARNYSVRRFHVWKSRHSA